MPLDGEEHARAQHDNLERKEDQGEQIYPIPIHHLSISSLLLDTIYRGQGYLKTVASTTPIHARGQGLFDAARAGSFHPGLLKLTLDMFPMIVSGVV
jgi:hypothetical protein